MGELFRLSNPLPTVAAGTKVLREEELAELRAATELLQSARERAERIREEAEQAYRERYEAGYRDGIEAGKMEHAEKMMETVLASVEFIEKIEGTVVDVVNQSIRKIVGEMDDEERIQKLVRTALNTVRGQQQVTVRVSPADEPAVSESLAAMTSSSYVRVLPDVRLAQGGCVLESELGVVDATLETQLKALENAFSAKIRRG